MANETETVPQLNFQPVEDHDDLHRAFGEAGRYDVKKVEDGVFLLWLFDNTKSQVLLKRATSFDDAKAHANYSERAYDRVAAVLGV